MVDEKQSSDWAKFARLLNAAGTAHVAAPLKSTFSSQAKRGRRRDEAEKGEVICSSRHYKGGKQSPGMLSPCRTSTSSLRALVAANKAPQLVVAPGKVHRETTWSSSSSAAASTSRCGPSTTYRLLHSSTKRTEGGRSRPIQSNSLSPAVDLPITPKAAKTVEEAQAWLHHAFPGLPLPDDIAMMMITHESWDHGVYSGHNRRLSFLGEFLYVVRGIQVVLKPSGCVKQAAGR